MLLYQLKVALQKQAQIEICGYCEKQNFELYSLLSPSVELLFNFNYVPLFLQGM